MCRAKKHCFDFYRKNEVPATVLRLAIDEIHLNRNLIEEFGEVEMYPNFNRALCESKIEHCYWVLNKMTRGLITDWEAIEELVNIHTGKD